MVYANQYSSIRPANIEDIPDILRIMQDYIDKGFLVPRTQESISEKLKDYVVYSIDNSIHGCGALHEFEDGMAEVAGIAVGANYRKSGIGDAIVRHLISVGRMKGYKKLFLLTTQALDWFYHFGFEDGTMASIEPLKSVTISVAQESIQIRTDLPDAELNDIVENINQRFDRSAKFQMDNRKRMALLTVELMSEIMELRKQLGRAKNYYDQMEKEVQNLTLLLDEGVDNIEQL